MHDPDDPRYKKYDKSLKIIAAHGNKTDDLVKKIAKLLRRGTKESLEEATKLAVNHTDHQKFKG